MKRLLISALSALAISSSAHAQDSIFVVVSGTKQILTAIDTVSLKRNGSSVNVWVFNILPRGKSKLFNGKPYTEVRTFDEFNCEEGKSKNLQINIYNGTQSIYTGPGSGDERYVVPDTVSAQTMKWVCGRGDMDKLIAFETRAEMVDAYNKSIAAAAGK